MVLVYEIINKGGRTRKTRYVSTDDLAQHLLATTSDVSSPVSSLLRSFSHFLPYLSYLSIVHTRPFVSLPHVPPRIIVV